MAAATDRVRLGTLVVCNDLRLPAVLAKTATTIDLVSGGRLELGMGAGWYEEEYHAAGVPFEPPGITRLTEALQIVTSLLSSPEASFSGRYYTVRRGREPAPAGAVSTHRVAGREGRPPRVACQPGRLAGSFNTAWAWTPEAYAGRVQLLERAARRAGRDPASVRRSVGLYCLPGSDPIDLQARWDRTWRHSPGPLHRCASMSGAGTSWWERRTKLPPQWRTSPPLGVEEIILSFGLLPFQVADASAVELPEAPPEAPDDFASEVFPPTA